jgi:hypothetical protein
MNSGITAEVTNSKFLPILAISLLFERIKGLQGAEFRFFM